MFAAVEDDFGRGAGVAVVTRHADGRLELDGWQTPAWSDAVDDLERLAEVRRIKELHVGASMLESLPNGGPLPRARPAVNARARAGLSLLRDLAAQGYVVRDTASVEVDRAVGQARVKEGATGLFLVTGEANCLVKALAWALAAAHKPSRVPTIR